ncbi:MAG TPA: Holliday junction resolvase RuvX [Bacteroidota bacterium]|nr:Holliday junction resolvase RuvX [Bacteroidota bacterium]
MTGVPGRVMGIDYGSRRVGIAVSDPLRIATRGLGVLENGPDLTAAIAEQARGEEVVLIVVGMPYAPDGGQGAKGEEVARFIAALRAQVPVPVETWDESFTSGLARQALIDGGMKQKQRREKGRVDEMAARLLLQEFLESTHHH